MNETNKIFPLDSDSRLPQLSEDKLMAYLDGKLPPAEQHKIELWLAGEGIESDALEGLHKLNPEAARASIKKINYHLHKAITKKKHARRRLNTDYFTFIAIVAVLLLAVLAYIVIRKAAR